MCIVFSLNEQMLAGITLRVSYNEIHSSCTRAAFENVGPLCVLVRVEFTIVY